MQLSGYQMTSLLLIRHATNAVVGRAIAGRAPGVTLSDEGREQVERLVTHLSSPALDCVATSPLERAVETATPLASAHGLVPEVVPALIELDFGEWTGKTLDELAPDPLWRRFNTMRGTTRIPGGELALEVQARAVGALESLCARFPEGRVAVVTHADVIRSVVAHYLGIPLDLALRIEIDTASVTVLRRWPEWTTLRALNLTGDDVIG